MLGRFASAVFRFRRIQVDWDLRIASCRRFVRCARRLFVHLGVLVSNATREGGYGIGLRQT